MRSGKAKAERRQFGRRRMTAHAWIVIKRRQPIACVVRNFSQRGALLEFPDRAPSAESFLLRIEDPPFEAQCDVRHRRGSAVGVYFVEPERTVAEPAPKGAAKQVVASMRERLKKPDRK